MVEATTLSHSTYTATSVQNFLDYLLTGATHWSAAKRGDLAYRGQRSGDWLLIPKAFRPGQLLMYDPEAPRTAPTRVVPQARAEFRAVHRFVKAADTSGLQITEAGGRLLLQQEPRDVFHDQHWEYSWPQNEIVETLALAQHHGVPTRLLDFTEDPLVAAHFAASLAWSDETHKGSVGKEGGYLAVWVIDLRFVRSLNGIGGRYGERIREIRVPRANNSFLSAQSGFFLMDRGANDAIGLGTELSIEKTMAGRAGHWNTGNRLAGRGITQTWFDELPVRQVRLSTNSAGELLRELENRGVTMGSLMPSLDRVVESLEFQSTIP